MVYIQPLLHWNFDAAKAGECDLIFHTIYVPYVPLPEASVSPKCSKSIENPPCSFARILWTAQIIFKQKMMELKNKIIFSSAYFHSGYYEFVQ